MEIMLDIETLGVSARPVIVSVGAVAFARGGDVDRGVPVGQQFYRVVDIDSCLRSGLQVDGGTVRWWLGRGDRARGALLGTAWGLGDVLKALSGFVSRWCGKDECVWSHGAGFDCTILEEAYRLVGAACPWKFWNVRDTRTLFDLSGVRLPRSEQRDGSAHHALDDAMLQARWVQQALRELWSPEVRHDKQQQDNNDQYEHDGVSDVATPGAGTGIE